MGGQKISSRLTLGGIVQFVTLVIVAVAAIFGLARIGDLVSQTNNTVNLQTQVIGVTELLHEQLKGLTDTVARGTSTWEDGASTIVAIKAEFTTKWQELSNSLAKYDPEHLETQYKPTIADVNAAFTELEQLIAGRDRTRLNLFISNDMEALLEPFTKAQAFTLTEMQERSDKLLATSKNTITTFSVLIIIVSVLSLAVIFGLGSATYRAIVNPLNQMMATVTEIKEGNYTARTEMMGGENELTQLGAAFDEMLDDRVTTLVRSEAENEQLNDSIINLLQAVSQLSQRDLTVKVPVTEDVTGPVADALNLLTNETAAVLHDVNRISEEVATASDKVKLQSDNVIAVAKNEQVAVEKTAVDLAAAADAMGQIAQLAQACNAAAETATKSTQAALQTVTSTVAGINSTRDTIRETEKRIKRLGERSQEISGVVNLINTIAERTHILALNASMHAASAGEAGRGFAVVADEVQRLAENAREATSQISTLVSNIQIETADTVNAMNAAITQVVDGSRLAEQAGDQMRRTQETTAELVAGVQQITSRSHQQARISNELLERAQQIQESSRQTSEQLQEQTIQTTNLVEYAKDLLSSVRVFRLPA